MPPHQEIMVFVRGLPRSHDPFALELPALAEAFEMVHLVPTHDQNASNFIKHPNVRLDRSLNPVLVSFLAFLPRRLFSRHFWQTIRLLGSIQKQERTRFPAHAPSLRVHARSYVRLTQALIALIWAFGRRPPDVVYSFTLSPLLIGLRLAWPSVPFAARAVGNDALAEQNSLGYIPLLIPILDALDSVLCVSSHLKDRVCEENPNTCKATHVLHLPIRRQPPNPVPSSNTPLSLLSISRIDSNKQLELVAGAVADIQRRGVAIRWQHWGDGPDKQALVEYCDTILTEGTIDFPGFLDPSEMSTRMGGDPIHLLVHAAQSEGLPLSVVEAQSAGLPVVAVDNPGTREALWIPGSVLLSSTCSTQELADGILAAMKLRTTSTNQRQEFAHRFFAVSTQTAKLTHKLTNLARR